jgi:hypothetical protein
VTSRCPRHDLYVCRDCDWDAEAPTADHWVNANITIQIPLDVPVTASRWEKQEAVGAAMDRLIDALPAELQEFVAAGRWEDMPR